MESLPPPPPAEIAYHEDVVPDLSDPIVIEAGALAPPIEVTEPLNSEQPHEAAPIPDEQPEQTRIQRFKASKVGKLVVGEGIGTALDIATMATGIPLPVREVAGSTLDQQIYGKKDASDTEALNQPSRMQKVAKKAGSIAMFAVAGIAAQKFGAEAANMISDRLSDGVAGEFITPLTAKLGAVGAINKFMK